METSADAVCLQSGGALVGIGPVHTAPFPGFATDMAPLLAAALLRARGTTTVCDTVFTNRFACAEGFAALGAPVTVEGNSITVGVPDDRPIPQLHGAQLTAKDLRGGAALVIAALQAQGESRLHGIEYIRRGYADLPGTLGALGAPVYGW